MKHTLRHATISWLPIAVVTTILSGAIYGAAQQIIRLSANDVPAMIAQQVTEELSAGANPQAMGANTIELTTSLSPFVIVFDDAGKVVSSSAKFNGQTPTVPSGIFNLARKSGENRFTWQPENHARFATVLRSYSVGMSHGFVLAGESLREPEKHIEALGMIIFGAWLVCMIASFLTVLAIQKTTK